MLNCWQEEADDRPTFEGLRRELNRMENQHKVNSHKTKQIYPLVYNVAQLVGDSWELSNQIT